MALRATRLGKKAIIEPCTSPGNDRQWHIIAEAAQHQDVALTIKNPLVVNGLQTSHEIFAFFKGGGEDDKRAVQVRVLEARGQHSTRSCHQGDQFPDRHQGRLAPCD